MILSKIYNFVLSFFSDTLSISIIHIIKSNAIYFSHPAIVLPLKNILGRHVSLIALIIGSLTPDFEYF
ncbi:DUF4184 family protein [Phocoenobacter atlanticus subsp. cyclopteri]|nr:DUF4184 family protein [Pasteurella atlantica]